VFPVLRAKDQVMEQVAERMALLHFQPARGGLAATRRILAAGFNPRRRIRPSGDCKDSTGTLH
jgi:hypothetical protein